MLALALLVDAQRLSMIGRKGDVRIIPPKGSLVSDVELLDVREH